MDVSQIYIAVAVVALAIIALLVFFVKKDKKEKMLTPLAGLAFGFILAGIVFSDDRVIGYGLIGIGVVLSIIDILIRSKKK
ncbi:MAG: hypothetical protein NTY68_00125 [Candidatus Micrarchaeota archaeon]|nr:hypothetical protein [Candidatus Micrarchaeota archaeon]